MWSVGEYELFETLHSSVVDIAIGRLPASDLLVSGLLTYFSPNFAAE